MKPTRAHAMGETLSKADLLTKMRTIRTEWDAELSRLSSAELTSIKTVGKWAIKDVLFHMANYVRMAACSGRPVGNSARPHAGRLGLLLPIICLHVATIACLGGGRPALQFSPDALPDATVGQRYSAIITVSQNATPVGEIATMRANLPPGLTLTYARGQNTAAISGVPTQTGTYKFTVSAWCFGTNASGQTGSHDYQITVR